eukprot:Opistho-1_new@36852
MDLEQLDGHFLDGRGGCLLVLGALLALFARRGLRGLLRGAAARVDHNLAVKVRQEVVRLALLPEAHDAQFAAEIAADERLNLALKAERERQPPHLAAGRALPEVHDALNLVLGLLLLLPAVFFGGGRGLRLFPVSAQEDIAVPAVEVAVLGLRQAHKFLALEHKALHLLQAVLARRKDGVGLCVRQRRPRRREHCRNVNVHLFGRLLRLGLREQLRGVHAVHLLAHGEHDRLFGLRAEIDRNHVVPPLKARLEHRRLGEFDDARNGGVLGPRDERDHVLRQAHSRRAHNPAALAPDPHKQLAAAVENVHAGRVERALLHASARQIHLRQLEKAAPKRRPVQDRRDTQPASEPRLVRGNRRDGTRRSPADRLPERRRFRALAHLERLAAVVALGAVDLLRHQTALRAQEGARTRATPDVAHVLCVDT